MRLLPGTCDFLWHKRRLLVVDIFDADLVFGHFRARDRLPDLLLRWHSVQLFQKAMVMRSALALGVDLVAAVLAASNSPSCS